MIRICAALAALTLLVGCPVEKRPLLFWTKGEWRQKAKLTSNIEGVEIRVAGSGTYLKSIQCYDAYVTFSIKYPKNIGLIKLDCEKSLLSHCDKAFDRRVSADRPLCDTTRRGGTLILWQPYYLNILTEDVVSCYKLQGHLSLSLTGLLTVNSQVVKFDSLLVRDPQLGTLVSDAEN